MNAPPISEATFTVEVARSEMVDPEMLDPETGDVAAASGDAELLCATESRADNTAKTRSANKAVENELIPCLVSVKSDSNRKLRADS